jgi:hypothetical protein
VSSGGDLLSELADYCYRKTVRLNTLDEPAEPSGDAAAAAQRVLEQTEAERLDEQRLQLDFSCAVGALTICRFMTDLAGSLGLSALRRMLVDQDMLMTLIPLLDSKPWERRRAGRLERYCDGRCAVVLDALPC